MGELDSTVEAVRKASNQGVVHPDFYEFIKHGAELYYSEENKPNLVGTMELFIDGPNDIEGVRKILTRGNPAERALANGGVVGVRNEPAAAFSEEQTFGQLLQKIESS